MVTAALVVLAQAPLSLPAGFRTFPEIAAAVGQTPTEVKCDPAIAHRMAFVSAKAISREGLLKALDLTLVPDGKRRLMKDANAAQEREWVTELRRSLERRYVRIVAAGIATADVGTARDPEDDWMGTYTKVMSDPMSTTAERRKADDAFLQASGAMMAFGQSGEISVRGLAAFPADVPVELFERGTLIDTLPLRSVSPGTLALLKKAYPALQAGPESIAVRRRTIGQYGPLTMQATFGVVDPGVVMPADFGVLVFPYSLNSTQSMARLIERANEDGSLKLRGYGAAVRAAQAEEERGRELANRYAADTPSSLGERASFSQVAEAWAKKGHDIVLELDPVAEWLPSVMQGGKILPDGSLSPRNVEGVLALRSPLKFVQSRRRYPFRALLAMEAAGAKAQDPAVRGYHWPPFEARSRYIALAGPGDRWETTSYRGWMPEILDRGASWARVAGFVPAGTASEAEQAMRDVRSGAITAKTGPEREWKIPLTELPVATQQAIAEELRHSTYGGGNILAWSPAAMALFIRQGEMTVTVNGLPAGPVRSISVSSDVPAFNNVEGGSRLAGE